MRMSAGLHVREKGSQALRTGISFFLSAVFSFQSRALRVRPRQPMGRESTDGLCISSADRSRWSCRDILCLPTVSWLRLPVLRPGSVRRRSRPCANTSSHHYLWPCEMPEWPLFPRNPPVRKRGVVGRHALCALTAEIVRGEQRGLRNHILPWSHSWWGVRVETTTICLWK